VRSDGATTPHARASHRTIARFFLGGAVTPALGQHASAVRSGGVGECDVKSMLAIHGQSLANAAVAPTPTRSVPAGISLAARARTVRAIAIAVSALHACAGA
jgi:hypothetical protein